MITLFPDGVEYPQELKSNLLDIDSKLNSKIFAEEINNSDSEPLRGILRYAIHNTSFYSNLPVDSKLTDFPVMNKTIYNKNYEEILVHMYDGLKTHKMYTSGSTGIPFCVVQNLEKRVRHIADLKYFGSLGGFVDHEPMCYLRAKPTATPRDQERDNIWQLDICNLNAKNLTDYYHVMIDKKCTTLIAYPSTLETAVSFWLKNFKNNSNIKTIFSTSETLTEETRFKLRKFFGNDVNIYARYSNTEQGILGQENGVEGEYFLNWASFFFEILKLDNDSLAEENELGRIVITDLYNKAFPMIRYDTGDVGKMKKNKDTGFKYLTELYGRRMDLIYDTKGEVVSPFLLCRTMRLSSGIEQWQFIQENECDYTLKITTNLLDRPNCDKEVRSFKNTLGERAKIHVEFVERIPVMNSLKRKLIVSNYKGN